MKYYNSMQSCSLYHNQVIEFLSPFNKFPLAPCTQSPPLFLPLNTQLSIFYHNSFPFLEFRINGIMLCTVFHVCLLLLSIIFLRYIHVAACFYIMMFFCIVGCAIAIPHFFFIIQWLMFNPNILLFQLMSTSILLWF